MTAKGYNWGFIQHRSSEFVWARSTIPCGPPCERRRCPGGVGRALAAPSKSPAARWRRRPRSSRTWTGGGTRGHCPEGPSGHSQLQRENGTSSHKAVPQGNTQMPTTPDSEKCRLPGVAGLASLSLLAVDGVNVQLPYVPFMLRRFFSS